MTPFLPMAVVMAIVAVSAADARSAEAIVHAPVLSYTPVHSPVVHREPVEHCHLESQWEPAPVSATGAIVGGIVGAAVGNSLGHGSSHRAAGAVAGGMLGASLGHDAAVSSGGGHYRDRRVCSSSWREVSSPSIVGYDVRYQWEGRVWETRMSEPPGPTIRLRVNAQPW